MLSKRGPEIDDRHAFVVEDENYVAARWPGDGYMFARRFAMFARRFAARLEN